MSEEALTADMSEEDTLIHLKMNIKLIRKLCYSSIDQENRI
jgi:hypothetical protein